MPQVPDEDIRLQARLDSPYVQMVSYRVRHDDEDRALLPGECPREPEWATVGRVTELSDGGYMAGGFGIPGREFGDVVSAARWLVEYR